MIQLGRRHIRNHPVGVWGGWGWEGEWEGEKPGVDAESDVLGKLIPISFIQLGVSEWVEKEADLWRGVQICIDETRVGMLVECDAAVLVEGVAECDDGTGGDIASKNDIQDLVKNSVMSCFVGIVVEEGVEEKTVIGLGDNWWLLFIGPFDWDRAFGLPATDSG